MVQTEKNWTPSQSKNWIRKRKWFFLLFLLFVVVLSHFCLNKGRKEGKKCAVRGGKYDYSSKGTYCETPTDSIRMNKLGTNEKNLIKIPKMEEVIMNEYT
jgi:hypothetical protein